MTDAVLDPTAESPDPPRKGRLLLLALPVIAGLAGFAPTYLGLWSPSALMEGGPVAEAPPGFVEVPVLTVSVPGPQARRVQMGLVLEIADSQRKSVEHLMPRVIDTATAFLAGVAPEAYDRRGILEVIRAELNTRIARVLGDGSLRDVLITEFALK